MKFETLMKSGLKCNLMPMKKLQPSMNPRVQTWAQALLLSGLLACGVVLAQPHSLQAISHQASRLYDQSDAIFTPVHATHGMVSSEHFLATQAGVEVLREGGNAIDAAVATAMTLAVVLPNAGNLGGGGFMLIRDASETQTIAIDFRETAPQQAYPNMFLDNQQHVIKNKSTESALAVATPGSVAGLLLAHEKKGLLPRSRVMAPAIKLAEQGFDVTYTLANLLARHHAYLGRWPSSRAIFFTKIDDADTCPVTTCPLDRIRTWREGERLVQRDLAWSLRQIAQHGAPAFYQGEIGQRIAAALAPFPGAVNLQDLNAYRPIERPVVKGSYRGIEIHSMPAPSSGGIHLIQMLNLLELFPVAEWGYGSSASIHLLAEVAKLAYADRAAFLGDPDFVQVPTAGLISKKYAMQLAPSIQMDRARPSRDIKEGKPHDVESDQTTHLSVVDAKGNMVSLTTTLNLNFGMGMVAAGTGILLNNEMDDFSVKPGASNAFGLVGSKANQVEPNKRPLSSMTPVIALKNGRPWLATGSPGGARIITTVLQLLINVIDHNMNIAEAMSVPRMHHQWMPDQIRLEKGFSPDTLKLLRDMGHDIRVLPAMGSLNTVSMDDAGDRWGASDPRRIDGAAIGVLR